MLNIRTLCTEGGNTIIWGEKWGREEKKNEDGGEKWKVHCLDTLIIQQYGSLRAKKEKKTGSRLLDDFTAAPKLSNHTSSQKRKTQKDHLTKSAYWGYNH